MSRDAAGWVAGPLATVFLWLLLGWRIVAVVLVFAVASVLAGVISGGGRDY